MFFEVILLLTQWWGSLDVIAKLISIQLKFHPTSFGFISLVAFDIIFYYEEAKRMKRNSLQGFLICHRKQSEGEHIQTRRITSVASLGRLADCFESCDAALKMSYNELFDGFS